MPYSENLAERVRRILKSRSNVDEKRMFGGVGFLRYGNMLVGVWQNSLIARLGPEDGAKALAEKHVRPFDVTGKPMKGWVMVSPEGMETEEQLRTWIQRAKAFVDTLPAK